jgi:hypothetical protein
MECPGELGEWFKPAVLKTADGKPSVSSNLTLSAKKKQKNNGYVVATTCSGGARVALISAM